MLPVHILHGHDFANAKTSTKHGPVDGALAPPYGVGVRCLIFHFRCSVLFRGASRRLLFRRLPGWSTLRQWRGDIFSSRNKRRFCRQWNHAEHSDYQGATAQVVR